MFGRVLLNTYQFSNARKYGSTKSSAQKKVVHWSIEQWTNGWDRRTGNSIKQSRHSASSIIKPWTLSHCLIALIGSQIAQGHEGVYRSQQEQSPSVPYTVHEYHRNISKIKSKLFVGRNPSADTNFEPPQSKIQLAMILLQIWFGANDLDWTHFHSLESSVLNYSGDYTVFAVIKRHCFYGYLKEKN